MASFARGITFATNGTVTAENLHNLIDQTTPRAGIITDRSVLTTMSTGDKVLIADTDDATNAYFITSGSLVGQALSGATYAGASLTAGTIATFNSTTGTVTNLTSSTATISTLSGNTTGGTYSGNIVATAGTVTTLTASTLAGAVSGGTYSGNVIATAGTVTTLTASTGTITNLSTTLAGDFTISQGTGTVGTRVAVVNTAQEYTRAHNFNATTLTSGTSIAWNLEENQVARLALATNGTIADPSNKVDGATYILSVTQSTGTNTLAWNASFKWPGGTTPTLTAGSGKTDIFTFVSNGTSLFGVASQNYS